MKKILLSFCFSLLLSGVSYAGSITDSISEYLYSGLDDLSQCSSEYSAVSSTAEHIKNFYFPKKGKFVLVNVAGGFLTAYEDGRSIFEMRTIVGKATNQTPENQTEITSVRFNPTWTVPNSIVKEENFRERVQTETQFFLRNKFEFRDSNNELIPLQEAISNPSIIARFVQSPGNQNALGRYRFNIQSTNSIYLHDTRDPERFTDGSPITLSHGCVRLEKPKEFAKWLTGLTDKQIDKYIKEGSTYDYSLTDKVPVVMGYFTAWPNKDGEILVYDDIYNKNKNYCN